MPRRPAVSSSPSADETGGLIKPTTRKPPPQPSGDSCSHGITCHFGLRCVYQHKTSEIELFKKREEAKLVLQEIALQVKQAKLEYKKQKIRQPLQQISNRGAGRPRNEAKETPPSLPAAQPKRTNPPAQPNNTQQPANRGAGAAPKAPTRPPSPSRPPPQSATTSATRVLRPHENCVMKTGSCGSQCILDAGELWTGIWAIDIKPDQVLQGREAPYPEEPPSPNVKLRRDDKVEAYEAISRSANDVWLFDCHTGKWYPMFEGDGSRLMRPINASPPY